MNKHKVIVLAISAAVIIMLICWILRSVNVSPKKTDTIIDSLVAGANANVRRGQAVVDATRQREVKARDQVKKETARLRDDELVSALNNLLANYRSDKDR